MVGGFSRSFGQFLENYLPVLIYVPAHEVDKPWETIVHMLASIFGVYPVRNEQFLL